MVTLFGIHLLFRSEKVLRGIFMFPRLTRTTTVACLTDKNSAKIFEDDKLSDKYGDTGIVKFGWNYGTHGFFCEGAVDDITDNDLLVIGNIHNEED